MPSKSARIASEQVGGIRKHLPRLAQELLARGVPLADAPTLLENAAAILLRSGGSQNVSPITETALLDALARASGPEERRREALEPKSDDLTEASYQQALELFVERLTHLTELLAQERSTSHELAEELQRQPTRRRRWLIRNARRFVSYGLAEHLLEQVGGLWHSDPQEAETLSGLALEIAEHLDEATYGAGLVSDLRAQALASLANSGRILLRLRNVEETFRAAEFFLERGTGDPVRRAQHIFLVSLLRRDQSRFGEAAAFLDEAASIHQVLGNLRDRARALLQKAVLKNRSGSTEEALEILTEVEGLTESQLPQLYFFAYHNLTVLLLEQGRLEEARQRIEKGRELADQAGGAIDRLKVDWIEGRILAATGHTSEAEPKLQRAMSEFFDHHLEMDGVAVALDLASLYLRTDRLEDAQGLIPELLARTRRTYQNVMAALVTLQQKLMEGTATEKLIQELDKFLDVAEANPAARFQPSGTQSDG